MSGLGSILHAYLHAIYLIYVEAVVDTVDTGVRFIDCIMDTFRWAKICLSLNGIIDQLKFVIVLPD